MRDRSRLFDAKPNFRFGEALLRLSQQIRNSVGFAVTRPAFERPIRTGPVVGGFPPPHRQLRDSIDFRAPLCQ
jgi:hypothetical protein